MPAIQKTPLFVGKDSPQIGQVPSIVLCNPNFAHNVGMTVRLASCYGFKQVWFTGDRVQLELEKKKRLPREERMKGYRDVTMINYDRPLEQFPKDVVPVAVEVRKNSERLDQFEHPKNAVYVFGPEDGSIPQSILTCCHRFLIIPTQKRYCLNLATAVATILWHRADQLGELPDVTGDSGIGYQDSDPNEVGVFGNTAWPPEEE
jgi:tRNA(Leu) C34 or U34 (ribose-2'-O)-methylase TrmL